MIILKVKVNLVVILL